MNIFVLSCTFPDYFYQNKNIYILIRHPGIPYCLQKLVKNYCEKIWDETNPIVYKSSKIKPSALWHALHSAACWGQVNIIKFLLKKWTTAILLFF